MNKDNKLISWRESMRAINKNLHIYLKYKLEKFDLKKEEVHFLHYICIKKKIEQNFLSEFFHVDKSTTTRKIKNLIDLGYIVRELDPEDHRKYILYPTDKGISMSNQIKEIFINWDNELINTLNPDEIEIFLTISNKLRKNSDNCIERMRLNEQK